MMKRIYTRNITIGWLHRHGGIGNETTLQKVDHAVAGLVPPVDPNAPSPRAVTVNSASSTSTT